MKLKGSTASEPEKKNKSFFQSITSVVSDIFQTHHQPQNQPQFQPKPEPQTYAPQPAQNEFYFDKTKGVWVINGKEADTEYDMGQEPEKTAKNAEELVPPPISTGSIQKHNKMVEPEKEVAPEPVNESFGKVTIGHVVKKKAPIKVLYTAQN